MATVTFTRVGKVFGDGTRALDGLDLEVGDGEFMVLVGPSGCGKTTALRLVAGLEEATEGEIRIADRVVNELGPRARDVAMVFQNYALYPHMSVYDNLAFGLSVRKLPKPEIRKRVETIAGVLGLQDMLRRKPGQLSGGQRQRVAMGRAIVRDPQVFLMDEPLSNLDAKLRVQMRAEISRIQRELGATTVYVTHDQVEAMTMGTRVCVLRGGELQQLAAPQTLYDAPANVFVATFIGSPAMNLLEARLERRNGSLVCALGDHRLPLPPERASETLAAYAGRPIAVGLRSEHLREPVDGSARLPGVVRLTEALGSALLVHVEIEVAPVLAGDEVDAAVAETLLEDAAHRRTTVVCSFDPAAGVRVDDRIEIGVDTRRLHFFDLETGTAIRP